MHHGNQLSSIVVRMILVFGLVFGTYNPSGYSYVHWLFSWPVENLLLKIFSGMVLIFLFWVVFSITRLALGRFGTVFLLLTFLAFVGTLWQFDLLPSDTWLGQVTLLAFISLYLTSGLVFSALRHRLSGQVESVSLT